MEVAALANAFAHIQGLTAFAAVAAVATVAAVAAIAAVAAVAAIAAIAVTVAVAVAVAALIPTRHDMMRHDPVLTLFTNASSPYNFL